MNRLKNLTVAAATHFDVCIIGSSVLGLGCALEAATRGLRVVVIETADFGHELGVFNSKTIDHSAQEWSEAVQNLRFKRAKAVLAAQPEKLVLKKLAPMFVHRVPVLTPYARAWQASWHQWSLKQLDRAKGLSDNEAFRQIDKANATRRYTRLAAQGVHSASLHTEIYVDDARYLLALAQTAAEKGAVLINHIDLKQGILNEQGQLQGWICRDALKPESAAFTLKARCFICANTGLFTHVRDLLGIKTALPLLWTKEAYLVLPSKDWPRDLALNMPQEGLVALPWQGQILVSRRGLPTQPGETPALSTKEAENILTCLNKWAPHDFSVGNIKSGHAQILAQHKGKKAFLQEKNGLILAFSTSWLQYRQSAAQIIDAAAPLLRGGMSAVSKTAELVLCNPIGHYSRQQTILQQKYFLSNSVMRRLNQKYGVHTLKVLSLILRDTSLKVPLIAGLPILRAEVMYAVIHEMACTVDDVLTHRIGLTRTNWRAAAEATGITASLMHEVIGWPLETAEAWAAAYLDKLIEEKEQVYPEPFD